MEQPSIREGDLLTIAQLQKLLPLGRSTIYSLCETGQLPCIRIGATRRRRGRVLVHRDDLRAFIERSRHGRTVTPLPVDVDKILAEIRGAGRR